MAQLVQCVPAVTSHRNLVAGSGEAAAYHFSDLWYVVDDEHPPSLTVVVPRFLGALRHDPRGLVLLLTARLRAGGHQWPYRIWRVPGPTLTTSATSRGPIW